MHEPHLGHPMIGIHVASKLFIVVSYNKQGVQLSGKALTQHVQGTGINPHGEKNLHTYILTCQYFLLL
jgi:hypothetical protein